MENLITKIYEEIDFDEIENCTSIKDNCVECCRSEYFESESIDYSCENKRKIYVVRYLPVHCKEVRLGLDLLNEGEKTEILNAEHLKVTCIGGGPGTDIMAFNYWLNYNVLFSEGNLKSIDFIRVDKCTLWDSISPKVIHSNKPSNLKVDFKKRHFDITQPNLSISHKSDLVILSYIVSEINESDIKTFANNILSTSQRNAIIVINDRDQTEVNSKIKLLMSYLNIESFRAENSQKHCDFSFPVAIAEDVQPKFRTSSIRYAGTLNDN